LFEA